MCQFFSGIIKPDHAGVWFDPNIDSHSEICEKFKIRDNMPRASFVKFEITPNDGDICNHAPENWTYKLDDDHKNQLGIPEWYNAEKGEKQAREALGTVLKKVTATGLIIDEVEFGRRIRKAVNCKIKTINGKIDVLSGGVVQYVRSGGVVKYVNSGGVVQYVNSGGVVQDVRSGGVVQDGEGISISFENGNPVITCGNPSAKLVMRKAKA